jgi:hypothetical protein
LLEIADQSPKEKRFYFEYWAGDYCIGLGDFERALKVKPKPLLGKRNSMQAGDIMSLKLALNQHITGQDVVTIFGPQLTKFGRENIVDFLHSRLSQIQKRENRSLLLEWIEGASIPPHRGMCLFNCHASYIITRKLIGYNFNLSPTAEPMCAELMRDDENTFREER